MGWARLDDGFHDHPKVDNLSLAAVGLYTLCLTWAHRHRRTAVAPGHVTEARVRKVAGKDATRLAGELVASGLWETGTGDAGGYLIHDFADYLPKERDPEERREAGRKGAARRWLADGNLPSASVASNSSRASAPAFPTRPDPDPQPSKTSSSRGTRIPDPFEITDEMRQWAGEQGFSDAFVRQSTERFVDYWRAQPGQKGCKTDWVATWRNWLRRDTQAMRPLRAVNESAPYTAWDA